MHILFHPVVLTASGMSIIRVDSPNSQWLVHHIDIWTAVEDLRVTRCTPITVPSRAIANHDVSLAIPVLEDRFSMTHFTFYNIICTATVTKYGAYAKSWTHITCNDKDLNQNQFFAKALS